MPTESSSLTETQLCTELTALSVFFGNHDLLIHNGELSDRLNPGQTFRWLAVNNGGPELEDDGLRRFDCLTGTPDIPPSVSKDKGSLHHSEGLAIGLKEVTTRFLLVLDPDFYVIRPGWVSTLLDHMKAERLAIFGSCWHPRWWFQHRGFPTVHFMLFDLAQIPLGWLDFAPQIRDDHWYRWIDESTWLPEPLRRRILLGRFKDTGWKIRKTVLRHGGLSYETLVPHYIPEAPSSLVGRWLQPYARLVPDRFSLTPRQKGYFTERSFLRQLAPLGYQAGWEEFYWRDEPFAVHFRNVGNAVPTDGQHPELDRLFDLRALKEASRSVL